MNHIGMTTEVMGAYGGRLGEQHRTIDGGYGKIGPNPTAKRPETAITCDGNRYHVLEKLLSRVRPVAPVQTDSQNRAP